MKVIVKFVRGNGRFVPGDVTQLDIEEAKKEESRNVVVILQELGEAPLEAINPANLPEVSEVDKLTCPICGKQFKNEKALRMHKIKVHGSV
jgi:hypothetical protein